MSKGQRLPAEFWLLRRGRNERVAMRRVAEAVEPLELRHG